MKRTEVLKTVKELPENFKLNDLIEHLIVLEKIDKGLEDVKAGRLVSHEKVKKEFEKKWLK